MSLRAALVAAAFLLFGCAGVLGVYLGVMSQAELLRPSVPTDAPGGAPHRSVMALDSARAPTAAPSRADAPQPPPVAQAGGVVGLGTDQPPATQDQAIAPPVAQPSDTASVAPTQAPAPAVPPNAPAQDSQATAEPPPTVVALNHQPQQPAKTEDAPNKRAITILQLGDSHTSADFLTGEIRRRLQETFGNGGSGYVTAGRPHIGVLSSTLKIAVSPGWTYKALQRSEDVGEFWMSGFNTVAAAAGETLTFSSERPETFDVIEIEAIRRPGGGAIDIRLDGALEGSFDLAGGKVEPIVIRLVPDRGPTNRVREITLTTRNEGVVSISSIAIFNTRAGLTYNSVGYPGATIDLLNKLDGRLFASYLRRLNPQIVVLSFGTNEASKANLDIAAYTEKYRRVIGKIRAALPAAAIVMIGPPEAEELPSQCKDKARENATCRRPSETTASASSGADRCEWKTLPRLADVREAQRKIAQRDGLVYWNWASIMPKECGADRWLTQSPALMAKDHVHFTIAGYKKSAASFLTTLVPVIEKMRSRPDAVSNN
jgi:lysophospholipase L1-like esterase